MHQRSVFGWLLAAAFCASVSCGTSSNSSGPKGFGLTCATDKNCASYDLVCSTDKTCVECTGDSFCKSSQVCRAGRCATPQDCNDSRDCPDAQVCDEDAGTCVDCLSSVDCKTGQKCGSDNTCSDRPTCAFTSDCEDGLVCDSDPGVCVTCRDAKDCGAKQDCVDYECVKRLTTGSGGSSGKAGSSTGGKASAGEETGGSVGVSGAGRGGGGNGGKSGSGGGGGGSGGSGGSSGCDCSGGTVCTPDLRCVPPTLIDDLEDCDDKILEIEGRSGDWAADADTGIDFTAEIGPPDSSFGDRTCAAWASGSELTLDNPNATFAFVGFLLNGGDAYDMSDYSGLKVELEAPTTLVQVVLKTVGGGYFQYTFSATGSSILPRTALFSSMLVMDNSLEDLLDLSTVSEVQFSVTTPADFAFAVHRVELL